MKYLICLILLFITILNTPNVFADVSAEVLNYEKEIINDTSYIKITTEYTYPDNTKHTGITRYKYDNFSVANVARDVQAHCETIVKYYIQENTTTQASRKDEMIDNFIAAQDIAIGQDKVTNLIYSLSDLYLSDLNITIPATGTIKDEYQ